ncbi:uncharacterized protein LOC128659240 [Bombina bombina]|uniref:uncharacterized protein LOC128659240 n=1 Tax=Bombina bombina TaxID=8345 RepID=UPI00235AD915|nr:uncharacterized protein LOC128659240 [Bombina bombina]
MALSATAVSVGKAAAATQMQAGTSAASVTPAVRQIPRPTPLISVPASSGAEATAGAGEGLPCKRVWILGHSYVHWAALRAAARAGGLQLGLLSRRMGIRWLEKRGMMWSDLPTQVAEARRRWGRPHVIVLHLGGNDVGTMPMGDLASIMLADIRWLVAQFPGVKIVWSQIISRNVWRHMSSRKAGFRVKRKLIRDVGKAVLAAGGKVITHDNIRINSPGLFRRDEVHLSDTGTDLFLHNIRRSLASLCV